MQFRGMREVLTSEKGQEVSTIQTRGDDHRPRRFIFVDGEPQNKPFAWRVVRRDPHPCRVELSADDVSPDSQQTVDADSNPHWATVAGIDLD